MDDRTSETAPRLLTSIALLSTLSAAFEVRRGMAARRAGFDPSAQEAASTARAGLRGTASKLRLLQVRLRLSLVPGDESVGRARSAVRRFPQAMMLMQAERLLHRVHQRLLSLYPAVGEELVESARLLRNRAEALPHLDPESFEAALAAFVEDGIRFLDALQAVY